MTQSTISVPESLTAALEQSLGGSADIPRWALEAIVVEAIREGLLSRGLGGDILGIGFHEREALFAQRGLVYEFSAEEMEAEGRDLAQMLLPR